MSGYVLKGKNTEGKDVNIPIAATCDSEGNIIIDTYATKQALENLKTLLLGDDEKITSTIDTIQEISNWIDDHGDDATALVKQVNTLEQKVDGISASYVDGVLRLTL